MARPRVPAESAEWEVIDIRGSSKMGWYYTTNIPSGGEVVRVKLSKHGTHVCLSCRSADACPHASFVSRYIDVNGIPSEVV